MIKNHTIISILLSWMVFLLWEGFIFLQSENIQIHGIRWDLILILPALIGMTGYYFLKIKKELSEES